MQAMGLDAPDDDEEEEEEFVPPAHWKVADLS
jgi:hypothetical protein